MTRKLISDTQKAWHHRPIWIFVEQILLSKCNGLFRNPLIAAMPGQVPERPYSTSAGQPVGEFFLARKRTKQTAPSTGCIATKIHFTNQALPAIKPLG